MSDTVIDRQPLYAKVAWLLAPILSYGKLVLEPTVLAEQRALAFGVDAHHSPGK